MNVQEYRDLCSIEAIKIFIEKLPGIGLPGNAYGGDYNRQDLLRKLAQDAWSVAEAMTQERNNHNPTT